LDLNEVRTSGHFSSEIGSPDQAEEQRIQELLLFFFFFFFFFFFLTALLYSSSELFFFPLLSIHLYFAAAPRHPFTKDKDIFQARCPNLVPRVSCTLSEIGVPVLEEDIVRSDSEREE
ncbi:hypothetical protein Taro_056292, partial [Colocasia esculenta]|nr:hypothetical protein [Colocasia esculenta]